MPDAAPSPFAYAILRVIPHVERGERLNAGVVVYCRQRQFLAAEVRLDRDRLRALAPDAPVDEIEDRLLTIRRIAAGDPRCGAVARLPLPDRFGWLVAPASTIVQPSEVHTGLCCDPAQTLDELFARLVTVPAR